jgi:NAD+ diphosphatase
MNPDYKFCPRCSATFSFRPLGGKDRAHCESCGFTHWNNPTPVVAAIVQYGEDILLARNAAWPPKTFALITGFLEANETAQEGIAREVKEETNLDVVETNLVGVYEFHRKNELIIAFHVVAKGEIVLSEELLEYKLLPPAKLRPWPAGTGQAVADWMTSKGLPFEVLRWGS